MKKMIKKIAVSAVAAVVCMAVFMAVYLQYFQYVGEKTQRANLNDAYDSATAPLEDGAVTAQSFAFDGAVYGVGFVFDMVDFSEQGELRFTLREGSVILSENTVPFASLVRNGGYTVFSLQEPLAEGEHRLEASFEAAYANAETSNKLMLYKTAFEAPGFASLTENGEKAQGSLAVQVTNEVLGGSVIRAFWVFAAAVSIVTGSVCFLLMSVDVKKAWVVFLLLVLVGTMYQVVMPPFSAPDEMSHYNTAYRLSNSWLGIDNVSGAVVKRICDTEEKFTSFHTDAYTYKYILENFFRPAGEQAALVESHGEYLGGYRLPRIVPAIGITVSRLLGFGGVLTAYFTRFLCLLAFAAMAACAYHVIPFAKALVAAVALLPITIHIGGTPSYDSTLIGLSLLLVSLLLAVCFGEEEKRLARFAALAIVSVAIAPLKSAYITLPFLMLLVPASMFGKKRIGYICKAGALGLAFLNFARFNLGFLIANITPAAAERVEVAAAAGSTAVSPVTFTVPYLLTHIGTLIPLVLNTFFRHFPSYLLQLFGGSLGYLNLSEVKLNPLIVFGFMLLVAAASLPREGEREHLGISHRLSMGAAFVLTLGMLVAACITWTPIDYDFIWGFQGRYLIPVLLPVMLAIRPLGTIRSRNSDAFILAGAWIFNIMAVLGALVAVMAR